MKKINKSQADNKIPKIIKKVSSPIKSVKKNRISIFKILFGLSAIYSLIFGVFVLKDSIMNKGLNLEMVTDNIIPGSLATRAVASGSEIEDSDLINRISRHIKIPNETVTVIGKVNDPEALEGRSDFYSGVKKDYYIVSYPSVSIMYDAKLDKVIKSTPVK